MKTEPQPVTPFDHLLPALLNSHAELLAALKRSLYGMDAKESREWEAQARAAIAAAEGKDKPCKS